MRIKIRNPKEIRNSALFLLVLIVIGLFFRVALYDREYLNEFVDSLLGISILYVLAVLIVSLTRGWIKIG